MEGRAAAEALSSLALGETVSSTEITEEQDEAETANPQQDEKIESEPTLQERLTDEEKFIIEQLKTVGPEAQAGRSLFFDNGFEKVTERDGPTAHSNAFFSAMRFLVENNIVEKPTSRTYVLAEGYEAFLAQ